MSSSSTHWNLTTCNVCCKQVVHVEFGYGPSASDKVTSKPCFIVPSILPFQSGVECGGYFLHNGTSWVKIYEAILYCSPLF